MLRKILRYIELFLYSRLPARWGLEEKVGTEQIFVFSDESGIKVTIPSTQSSCERFAYRLYDRHMKPLHASKKTEQKSYHFTPPSDGMYSVLVKGYIGNKKVWTIRRERVDYFSPNTRQAFKGFLREESFWTPSCFQFQKVPYPYQIFAVHTSIHTLSKQIGTAFLDPLTFTKELVNTHTEIIYDQTHTANASQILSGIVLDKDGMRYGQEDYDSMPCIIDDTQIGQFTYLRHNKNEIEIGNDFFGIGRLYCYHYDNEWLIANNFYFLLLLIKETNGPLHFDYAQILAIMANQQTLSQQILSRNREVKGCVILPADKKIRIAKDGGISFVDKRIHQAMFTKSNAPALLDEDALFTAGIEEIKSNLRSIMKNSRFSRYSFDLTGGLDSRCVFSALKMLDYEGTLPDKKAICINTAVDARHTKDSSIACFLNNGEFDWIFDKAYDRRIAGLKETLDKYISQIGGEGYFFPARPLYYAREYKETELFSINGFYGEIVGKPFYSRNIRKKAMTEDEFIVSVSYSYREDPLSGDCTRMLRNNMKNELAQLPGKNLAEKYELHYLFYRNPLHCGCAGKYRLSNPGMGVLMSPSLFYLKHQDFQKWDDVEEELELLDRMNANCLTIPFDNIRNEAARIKYLYKHKKLAPFYKRRYAKELADLYQQAAKRYRAVTKLPDDIKSMDKNYEAFTFSLIRFLAEKDPTLREKICLPIWSGMQKRTLAAPQVLSLMWKMLTLTSEICLFEKP